jgi:hypothetical protein
MTRALRLAAVFALTAPLLLASGCKQGIGDRCQTTSDCDDGLVCVLPGTVQVGGTCKAADQSGGTDDMNVGEPADMAKPTHD